MHGWSWQYHAVDSACAVVEDLQCLLHERSLLAAMRQCGQKRRRGKQRRQKHKDHQRSDQREVLDLRRLLHCCVLRHGRCSEADRISSRVEGLAQARKVAVHFPSNVKEHPAEMPATEDHSEMHVYPGCDGHYDRAL
eukprot:3335898-Rhodomonas_salina.1